MGPRTACARWSRCAELYCTLQLRVGALGRLLCPYDVLYSALRGCKWTRSRTPGIFDWIKT
eukprot:9391794-Pyramimonas_sp.AAC.1